MSERLPLRVRKLSGVVSTDDILPARHKHRTTDPAELARYVFEDFLPGFAASLQPGSVLVSERLFGIGSSREQAVSALKAAGVVGVIAPCFGRIFFRNAWNLALFAVELDDYDPVDGEACDIDLAAGIFRTSVGEARFRAVPAELLAIYRQGGLLASLAPVEPHDPRPD
jgi:3-isopropylmalate/(R)-2-methylmalate dehydratase small subunit